MKAFIHTKATIRNIFIRSLMLVTIIILLQVDFIINEATNLDNLALLYEGWTPWV